MAPVTEKPAYERALYIPEADAHAKREWTYT